MLDGSKDWNVTNTSLRYIRPGNVLLHSSFDIELSGQFKRASFLCIVVAIKHDSCMLNGCHYSHVTLLKNGKLHLMKFGTSEIFSRLLLGSTIISRYSN